MRPMNEATGEDPDPGPGPTAETLYSEWLRGTEDRGEAGFEALVLDHPEHADAVRRLHERYAELEGMMRRFVSSGTLAEELGSRYGADIDPRVELVDEEPQEDFTTEVLGRLSNRAGSTRYRLKGEVAEGGMGAILRVWDEDLRRHLAMKVMLGRREAPSGNESTAIDRQQLARFLEEAQVTGQLDHPNIVPVHELGLDTQGHAYFTMKLVKGRDLKAIFDRVRTGEDGWNTIRALGVVQKVCEAMSYAHDKGVIHRDLKPANVMVGRYGEVYVMDWGLAKILGREDVKDIRLRPMPSSAVTMIRSDRKEAASDLPDSPLFTMDGDVVGTPAYMPPEQANGDIEAMGPHSDIYAVGAVLYHLLAGHMPYVREGEKASNYAVWRWVKDGPPPSLTREAPGASTELIAIADKAMARDRHDRYAHMTDLARDLGAYLEGRVVSAYEAGAWAEGKKWIRRNRALAASLAAAVVILVGGVVSSLILADSERQARIEAQENEAAAARLRDAALDREREVLVRGLIQDLEAFHAASNDLPFAEARSEPAYIWWPRRARLLLSGQQANSERGLSWRPGLADAEQRLEALREHALPRTDAEIQADRESHPRYREYQTLEAELLWNRRMQGEESWPDLKEVEASLDARVLERNASALSEDAWSLVDPDYPTFGGETYALILATRALGQASSDRRARILSTLAWARYRCGSFEIARDVMDEALDVAPQEEYEAYRDSKSRLELAIASWSDPDARTHVEELNSNRDTLAELVQERRTWRLQESELQWRHDQLSKLVDDLRELEERLEYAVRTVETPEARARWAQAISAIEASPHYGGLRLTPQIGLLPIGMDPETGFMEFVHMQTGEAPIRKDDGKLVLSADMGLVLVLLPGGKFLMGAQSKDPQGDNYDPNAAWNWDPVHEVEVNPYFLSKYEMSSSQWRRAAGWQTGFRSNPDVDPAINVSWDDCTEALTHFGNWIQLPTGAQWEFGCRGGTTSPWWTGVDESSLEGVEWIKVGEQDAKSLRSIGLGAANPFGLHDMHGNVAEWCLDDSPAGLGPNPDFEPPFPWGGSRDGAFRGGRYRNSGRQSFYSARVRLRRGGSFTLTAREARFAFRLICPPETRSYDLGLRPARGITP